MIIAFDCDDVLVDYVQGLVDFTNNVLGIKRVMEDMTEYSFDKFWGCSIEEAISRVDRFHRTQRFRELEPILGAIEGVRKLKSMGHDLVVISSRPDYTLRDTFNNLRKHYGNAFSRIYFSKNPYTGRGDKDKRDFCKELDVKMLVEDNLVYAIECAEVCDVLLLNTHWNQTNELPNRVKRVSSWEEIVDEIEKIK